MSVARIARQELRHAWRTQVIAVLGVLLALMLAGAAFAGYARSALAEAQRARYQALVEQQWQDQPDRHPHRVSHYGFLVFRPRAPLGFFDTGVESFTGSSIFLEAHRQNSANFSEAGQSDSARRFGDLTMAVVLQLFVPLLIFALAGIAVTREREGGTLSLILCQGTSWRALLWGKLTGTLLAATVLVAPGLVVAAAWLGVGGDRWSSDAALRTASLAMTHVLYFIACTALALLVSVFHRTSRGAMATLVGLWIALWIVLPRALPGVAAGLYPLPSRAAFEAGVEQRVRELGDSHNPDDPTFLKLRLAYLDKYGVSRLDDLPVNYTGVVMHEGEKATAEAFGAAMATLTDTYRRHGRLVDWAGFLSPYVAMRTVSMSLAGVDVPHALEFEQRSEAYRYALIQRLNELHITDVAYARDRYEGIGAGGAPTRQRISRDYWRALPPFAFTHPTLGWALHAQSAGVVALSLWVSALVGAVMLVGRRGGAV